MIYLSSHVETDNIFIFTGRDKSVEQKPLLIKDYLSFHGYKKIIYLFPSRKNRMQRMGFQIFSKICSGKVSKYPEGRGPKIKGLLLQYHKPNF